MIMLPISHSIFLNNNIFFKSNLRKAILWYMIIIPILWRHVNDCGATIPTNMRCWLTAGLMLVHRLRRWPNIIPALACRHQRQFDAGWSHGSYSQHHTRSDTKFCFSSLVFIRLSVRYMISKRYWPWHGSVGFPSKIYLPSLPRPLSMLRAPSLNPSGHMAMKICPSLTHRWANVPDTNITLNQPRSIGFSQLWTCLLRRLW